MAIPTNRTEFIQYCLRKLGEPVIKVNVAVEQIEDRIEEGLQKFYERHYEGCEDVFILYDIKEADTTLGYIQLDNDIVGVIDVFRPQIASGINASEFQFYMQEIYNAISPNSTLGGLSYFYMYSSHLTLLNRFFNPDRQFEYNGISNKLIIAGGLKSLENTTGGLIIRAKRRLAGEESLTNPSNTVVHNIWKNRWFQNYCTSLIKEQWGQNLGKYQNVQLLGGVVMNGDQIKLEAREEKEKLEQELELTYELPPTFIWA